MSDVPEWQAAERIGERVLEMCDRLVPVAKISPKTQARWDFGVGDVEFEMSIKVKAP